MATKKIKLKTDPYFVADLYELIQHTHYKLLTEIKEQESNGIVYIPAMLFLFACREMMEIMAEKCYKEKEQEAVNLSLNALQASVLFLILERVDFKEILEKYPLYGIKIQEIYAKLKEYVREKTFEDT
jgi:hypothetical protein